MCTRLRCSLALLLLTVLFGSVFEASAGDKKKAKRRNTRTIASRKVVRSLVLPVVIPSVATPEVAPEITRSPQTFASSAGRDTTVNASSTRSGLRALPARSNQPPTAAATATAGQLLISEFRLSGPGLPAMAATPPFDEFIEIYNNSGATHTVQAASGTGYAVASSDGTIRCVIPNTTIILARGHFLCANTTGYSLSNYPAGNLSATPDASYTTDIPDNVGIALFNNNTGGASFSLANRIDAVGSTTEANSLYKEGTGYPALTTFNLDYSFVRDMCGKGGSISTFGNCTLNGFPKDTDNNAADFFFVNTTAVNAGAGQRLGSPGPEGLFSPMQRNSAVSFDPLDPCVALASTPNRVRDFTSDPANNSTAGTIEIRRTITNTTGSNITRLRFRIIDITTQPAPAGIADLRARTSSDIVVTVDRAPCGSGTSNVTVSGTTLEDRFLFMGPPFQPNGGGFNASMSAGTVGLVSPLGPGSSIDLRFLFGIQQTGMFRFYLNIEVLP